MYREKKNHTFQNLSEVETFFYFPQHTGKSTQQTFFIQLAHVSIRAAYLSCFIVFHRFILLRVFVLNPFFYPPPSVDFA